MKLFIFIIVQLISWTTCAIVKKDFIIVFSGQRSGSTSFSADIHNSNHCIKNQNEYFHHVPKQSGNAKEILGDKLFNERAEHMLESLHKLRDVSCKQINAQRKASGLSLCDHCVISLKLFSVHFNEEYQLHHEQLRRLLVSNKTSLIFLERPVLDRYCSHLVAIQEGDWQIKPSETHQHKPCKPCDSTSHQCSSDYITFKEQHESWFKFGRNIADVGNQVRIEVPFEKAVGPSRGPIIQSILALSGLTDESN